MRRLRTVTALLVCSAALFSRAGSLEFFGLDHFSIGDASLYANAYSTLGVSNLVAEGTNGIATILGEADSGAFFFPDTWSIQQGYFMRADAYGLMNGNSNALIGTLNGSRGDYATFYANADYSAIGATSLTFQAWSGHILLAETTTSNGYFTIYSEYAKPVRANPWCLRPNGEHGASIEFHYPPAVWMPGCEKGNGCPSFAPTRLFIRPNGITNLVNSISRTEIFGGGGLEFFLFNNVELGMFGHAHAALGKMKFAASNDVLRVDNVEPLAEDGNGTLVRLDHASTAGVQFQPLEIAGPNTNEIQERIDISCSGTDANGYIYFISTARLMNSNGVLLLSTYRAAEVPTILALYSNSVLVATQMVSGSNIIAITGTPRLTAAGASADTLAGPAGMSLDFDGPATFELEQGAAMGNRVKISATQTTSVADLTALALQARVIPSFTITNESSTFTAPQLSITRSNESVILRWADPASAYLVEGRSPLSDDGWGYLDPDAIVRTNGLATFTYGVGEPGVHPVFFFRLARSFYND